MEIKCIANHKKNDVGQFGCITGAGPWVKNLKDDTVNAKGGNYTGGIAGFADFGSYWKERYCREHQIGTGDGLLAARRGIWGQI